MQYTETELNKLIKSVETEFAIHLAKMEDGSLAPLAKSEDEKPKDKEEKAEKPAESKEEKPAEAAPAAPAEEKAAPAAEGKEEAPKADAAEGKEAAPAEGEQPAAAAEGEGHDYDDEDMEHMHKMYSSMSKGELKAHHDACRRALDSQGMQKCGDMQMAKSETATAVEVPADVIAKAAEVEILKSELSAKSTKLEELKKSNEVMSEFIAKILGKKSAPQGKAITNLDVIAKSEAGQEEKVLSKSEITAKLSKKASEPSLSKSDRELINAYYTNGASVNTINHLLK